MSRIESMDGRGCKAEGHARRSRQDPSGTPSVLGRKAATYRLTTPVLILNWRKRGSAMMPRAIDVSVNEPRASVLREATAGRHVWLASQPPLSRPVAECLFAIATRNEAVEWRVVAACWFCKHPLNVLFVEPQSGEWIRSAL